jgi:hypothetical protein
MLDRSNQSKTCLKMRKMEEEIPLSKHNYPTTMNRRPFRILDLVQPFKSAVCTLPSRTDGALYHQELDGNNHSGKKIESFHLLQLELAPHRTRVSSSI